ncbi:hypothetical protein QQF64_014088 [Cirrhinus molitorella]|uniref:Uncharacterized protein n=1 Tax=Cirrhinus molitorella TaxID=172907 RepID=A0ABR3LSZ4_9TELE
MRNTLYNTPLKDDFKKLCLSPTPKDLCSRLALRMRQRQVDIDLQHIDRDAHFYWLHKLFWCNDKLNRIQEDSSIGQSNHNRISADIFIRVMK